MHKKQMERVKLANEKLVGPQSDRLRKEIGKLEVRGFIRVGVGLVMYVRMDCLHTRVSVSIDKVVSE